MLLLSTNNLKISVYLADWIRKTAAKFDLLIQGKSNDE